MAIFAAALTALLISCNKNEPVIDIVDFEELDPGSSGVWNGSEGEGEFSSGNIDFPNDYNPTWQSWSGFSFTNHSDSTGKDFTNQYCSITASGAGKSSNYGVYYFSGTPDTVLFRIPEKITSVSVANSVYAYTAMLKGNPFAKKFGGDTGSDPDWFKLTLTAINSANETVGKVDIFLADFRFSINSKDYISNTWTSVDLSAFGFIKKIVFEISSSDTGDWGINTPAYVCVDNIIGELDVTLE